MTQKQIREDSARKPSSISVPQRDSLLIGAELLLEYDIVNRHVYKTIGVRPDEIQTEPFFEWLGPTLKLGLEDSAAVQLVRDARLAEALFAEKAKVYERSPLDLVHMFIESGSTVYVSSHESQEALTAVVARAGLPNSVKLLPLVSPSRHHEVVSSILSSELSPAWLLDYQLGLSPRVEKQVVATLGACGILVNVKPGGARQTGSIDERLIDLVNERWSYQ